MSANDTIAVTGVGGGVGQSIIKALQHTDYNVVALDGNPLGTGLYVADSSFIVPYANQLDYVDKVLQVCKQNGCKLLFPGLDAELPVFAANKKRFDEIGCTVIVSSEEVIEISNNKMTTFTEIAKTGVRVPQTYNMANTSVDDLSLSYPFILKQREGGARSQNLYLIKSRTEFDNLLSSGVDVSKHIAQEYIEGDEYTCGTVNLGGVCKGVIIMRRILRDGDTYKCFSVINKNIEDQVRKVVDAIKPFGACNIQLRVKDNEVYVFEINARCSGTTGARALCGFNEPKMIADFILKSKEPTYKITEQTILRYWNELVVDNDKIEAVQKDRQLINSNHPQLWQF